MQVLFRKKLFLFPTNSVNKYRILTQSHATIAETLY